MNRYIDDLLNEIEAIKLTGDNVTAVALWCSGIPVTEHDALNHDQTFAGINVPTKGDTKRASENDWVIRLPDDSFDVLKGWQFRSTYREV